MRVVIAEAVRKNTLSIFHTRHKYLFVFLLGTLMYVAAVIPSIIVGGGLFHYYGDYAVNYVEGMTLTVRSLQEGSIFWNPTIDLGSSFFNSFGTSSGGFATSFFTYLLLLFPIEWVPYLLPFIMALKYGLAALTSFVWLRGFTKTDYAALIGALLYAFSGFQAINVVYGIFHDITAFFPLYLYTFDRLIQKKGKVGFAIMSAVMAFQSLYFLFGQIVFMLIYYFVRYFRLKDIKSGIKQLCTALLYGAIGVSITGVFLLDGIAGLLGTGRTSNVVSGSLILAYENGSSIWEIIKSMFFIPEHMGYQGLFFNSEIDWGSVSLYLPLISVSGVIAYFVSIKGRLKRDWKGKLAVILFVMSLIPVLNSSFSLFNSCYYARWFYMFILILCLLTVTALERDEVRGMKIGVGVVIAFTVLFSLIMACSSTVYIYIVGFSLLTIPLLVGLSLKEKTSGSRYINKRTLVVTAVACCISTGLVLFSGNNMYSAGAEAFFKENVIKKPLELDTGTFGRTEGAGGYNLEFMWDIPATDSFVTTVTPSIFTVFKELQNGRAQRATILPNNNGLRQLISTRYYIDVTADLKISYPAIISGIWDVSAAENTSGDADIIPAGFEKVASVEGFDLYENKHFIPMGVTFDTYILEGELKALIDDEKDRAVEKGDNQWVSTRLLVKDIVLNDEQAEKYKELLASDNDYKKPLSNSEFFSECDKRAETACTSFTYDGDGYVAEATLEKDNLIFFSIPYDKGFTAYVDGIETEIEKVDFGFMAVPVKAGTHTIRFYYRPYFINVGIVVSVIGALMLLLTFVYGRLMWKYYGSRTKIKEINMTSDEKIFLYSMTGQDRLLVGTAQTIIEAYNDSFAPSLIPKASATSSPYYDIRHSDKGYYLLSSDTEDFINPRILVTSDSICDFIEQVFHKLAYTTIIPKWHDIANSDAVYEAVRGYFDIPGTTCSRIELSNEGVDQYLDRYGQPIQTIWLTIDESKTSATFELLESGGFTYFDRDLWYIEL